MRIQLLTFPGCPLASNARVQLESALEQCGRADYQELDLTDPQLPPELRGWGSPTILIDGCDLLGQQPTGGRLSCRVYDTALNVPTAAMIVEALGRGA